MCFVKLKTKEIREVKMYKKHFIKQVPCQGHAAQLARFAVLTFLGGSFRLTAALPRLLRKIEDNHDYYYYWSFLQGVDTMQLHLCSGISKGKTARR